MFVFLCMLLTCCMNTIHITASQSTHGKTIENTPTIQKRPHLVSTSLAPFYEANIIFDAISFPLDVVSDTFTLDIFQKIDKAFGSQGLNLTSKQVELIKKTYLYLIFLAKLYLVQTNPKYQAYRSDFSNFLIDNNQALPHIPDEKLVTSQSWSDVVITAEDIQGSPMWQLFCQSTISDTYTFFYKALDIIHDVEGQTFNYIPHIETSFYDQDYTSMRHINELIRVKVILEQTKRKYYLDQCPTWKNLPITDPTSPKKQNKPMTLEHAVLTFRKTNFYKNTHDIYTLLGITQNNSQTISTKDLMSPKQLASPLKEHVWCFFMLNEIMTMLYNQITTERLEDVLYFCSHSNISPNLFSYTQDDYIYFEEMLAIKSKAEGTHTKSVHPSPTQYKKEDTHIPITMAHDIHQAVQRTSPDSLTKQTSLPQNTEPNNSPNIVQQSIWSGIGDIFHHMVHEGDAIKTAFVHTYESAKKATVHLAKSIEQGAVGFGASIIGNISDTSSIKEYGSKEEKSAFKNLRKASSDLQKTVNNVAALGSGVAQEAFDAVYGIPAELVSVLIDDKQLGVDFTDMMNQTISTIATVGAKLNDVVIEAATDAVVIYYQVKMELANIITAAAVTLFTGGHAGINELKGDWHDLLKTTVKSIVLSFHNLVKEGKQFFHTVMMGIGAIINSLTTLFINISKEITFIAAAAWDLTKATALGLTKLDFTSLNFDAALNNAKETRNMVKNKLNAHRQTINQVMGVAISIGFAAYGIYDAVAAGAEAGTDAGATDALEDELGDEGGVSASSDADAASQASDEAGSEAQASSGGDSVDVPSTGGDDAGGDDDAGGGDDAGDDDAAGDAGAGAGTGSTADAGASGGDDEPDSDPDDDDKPDDDDDDKDEPKDQPKSPSYLKGLKMIMGSVNLAINAVFGTFNIISGLNSDDQNELQEKQQAKNLLNFWKFLNDQKIETIQQQNAYLQEVEMKQQATIGAQALALAFVKNFSFAGVNKVAQNISKGLAKSFIIPLLTPNTDDMRLANIGTTWGIGSNYLNLYPTQGYSTATTGRPNFPFAQEVAQAPQTGNVIETSSSTQTLSGKKKQPSKMWFNQKVVALDKTDENGKPKNPQDPLKVVIDLEFIYTINGPFYVGLYLGGRYYDYTSLEYLNKIKKDVSKENIEPFDLDYAYHAKMVVLFRTSAKAPIQIGVYENEGKNWIVQEALPSNMQFNEHHIYHIDTSLNKEALDIVVWVDNDLQNKWTKSVTITELKNQRTYGVISSGAAIQWKQVAPKPTLNVNSQARPPLQRPTEIAREKKSKIKVAQLTQPKFGSMKLQPLSKQAILFGQYLYSTQDTNLKKTNPKDATDYLVFATNRNGTVSNPGTAPGTLDTKPETDPNALVSVITGKVYNQNGHVVAHTDNLWNAYNQKHGPFATSLDTYITNAQQSFLTKLKNITFGSFDLDIISQEALAKSQFVYKCNQTLDLKDSKGKAILDYVIMAEVANNKLGNQIGMPPTSSKAQGVLSLISGDLYTKTSKLSANKMAQPIAKGYSKLDTYENQFNQLDPQALTDIQTAKKAYFTSLTAEQKSKQKKSTSHVKFISTTNVSPKKISLSKPGISLKSGPTISLNTDTPSKGKISNLQKDAAGSAGFQLPVNKPAGPPIKL